MEFERQLHEARPEHSLLMCYGSSLGFFENRLLDSLQAEGAGEVILLLDAHQFADTFSERTAVQHAGQRYRVHPVPSHGSSAFHPKLYLARHKEQAALWVASANLTLSGLRDNVEIVDRVKLSPDGSGDSRAFQAYCEFLGLVAESFSLSAAAEEVLQQNRKSLNGWLPDRIPDTGPEFLHSLQAPLLQQLETRLPSDIERVRIVSPFYDARSDAVLRVAQLAPSADLSLYKREGRSDFAGGRVAPIADRLEVFSVLGAGDRSAPLHGKLYVFERGDRAWAVCGSANCSSPALLRDATDPDSPGNVEAVILRELPDGMDDVDRLFSSIRTQKHTESLDSFSFQRSELRDQRKALTVLGAELQKDTIRIELLWDEDVEATDSLHFGVELEGSDGGSHSLAVKEVSQDTPQTLICESERFEAHTLTGPLQVVLKMQRRGTGARSGRTWLSYPHELRKSSDERVLARSLRRWRARGRGDAEFYDDWPSYFRSLADALMSAEGRGRMSEAEGDDGSERANENEEGSTVGSAPSVEHAPEDLFIDESTMPRERSRRGTSLQRRSLKDFISAFDAWFGAREESELQKRGGDHSPGSPRNTPPDQPGGFQSEDGPQVEKQRWDEIEKSFEHDFVALLDRAPSQAIVGGTWDLVEGVLRFLLAAYCDESRLDNHQEENPRFRRSITLVGAAAFSIAGTLQGQPKGFFVRALTAADTELREHTRTFLNRNVPDERFARTSAILASAIALHENRDDPDADFGKNILAGLQLVASHIPGWRDHLQLVARSLVSDLPVPLEADLVSQVLEPRSADDIPELRDGRAWLLVQRLLTEDLGDDERERCEEVLERLKPCLAKHYLRREQGEPVEFENVLFSETSDEVQCGRCFLTLPTATAQTCRNGGIERCQECGVVLVPLPASRQEIGVLAEQFQASVPDGMSR